MQIQFAGLFGVINNRFQFFAWDFGFDM